MLGLFVELSYELQRLLRSSGPMSPPCLGNLHYFFQRRDNPVTNSVARPCTMAVASGNLPNLIQQKWNGPGLAGIVGESAAPSAKFTPEPGVVS